MLNVGPIQGKLISARFNSESSRDNKAAEGV